MIKEPCAPQAGADVELFVKNAAGEIVPCVGFIAGTKEEPFRPEHYPAGYAMQEDNVMCEFNIPPVPDGYTGRETMHIARGMVKDELAKVELRPQWNLSEYEFTPAQLDSKQAQTIGCEVDYDAYTGGQARTNVPKLTNWRACGGHIHLGGDFKCPDFVAALFAELFLSVHGAGIAHFIGQESVRETWYGRPGIFRSKPYGIEYRTLNNQWAKSNTNAEWTMSTAANCATYLTNTPATDLQKAFRSIPWTQVREYMLGKPDISRGALIQIARGVGVPI
jgi:hypothetical protein